MERNDIQIEVKVEYPDIYEQKCRVCLLEGTLFIFAEPSDLLEWIQFFGGIDISKDDTLPKYLCKTCHCLLQSAILFRKKAQETNSKLLEQNNLNLSLDFNYIPVENKTIIKTEGSNASEYVVENTPEENIVMIKSESCNVTRNLKNTPKRNKINNKSDSSNVSRKVVKNTPKRNKVTVKCVGDILSRSDANNSTEAIKVSIKSEGPNILSRNDDQEEGDQDSNKSEVSLSRNVSNTCSRKIYECASCKIEFSKKKDYNIHINSKHSHIECPVCQKLTPALRFKRHLQSHQSDSQVICEVCGNLYQKGAMAKHLLLHSNNLPFPCKLCPYRGRCSEALKLHMRKHTGQKPYACQICQMSFITKSNLNRHALKHSKLRPHKCGECNKSFRTNRDMITHIKTDHNGIKDFECKICGNKYGAKRILRKHEVQVHKRDKMIPGRKPLYLQPEYKTSQL